MWLAERREPMVQRVAVKLIKPGMDSKSVIARFEQERQALAVMDHPNVAKVYDGGLTPEGRPYFVMEYVQGEPITEFCDRHTLTIEQRLELCVPVCQAVQHAHHKGIIHRDIKPSNILVSISDGRATPKVIDFGVAKAVSHTLTEKTIFTEHGQLIGTPEYMSPEQAEMGALDIDTRTDVYALGVVLYELMAGVPPFDPGQLRDGGFDEIRRTIRDVQPPTPSKRLLTMAADGQGHRASTVARNRQASVPQLVRDLRRELEWVPLKAMRKDRRERYATASDLAADIGRFLKREVVLARPPSMWYLVRKTISRSPFKVAMWLMLSGLLITPWACVPLFLTKESAALYVPLIPMTLVSCGSFVIVSEKIVRVPGSLPKQLATTGLVWASGSAIATFVWIRGDQLLGELNPARAGSTTELTWHALLFMLVHPPIIALIHRVTYLRAMASYVMTAVITFLLLGLILATSAGPVYLIYSTLSR